MAKWKKEDNIGEDKSSQSSEVDLPKRIKTYLNNSTSDPSYRVKESERIVDEILKSPVVVAKVSMSREKPLALFLIRLWLIHLQGSCNSKKKGKNLSWGSWKG